MTRVAKLRERNKAEVQARYGFSLTYLPFVLRDGIRRLELSAELKAAKEFLRFMNEAEQMDPWVQAAIGYVTPALRYYEKNPIWTVDPKHTPYRDSMKNMLPSGYAGKMGYASAGALADFIVVNMVAEAASGA